MSRSSRDRIRKKAARFFGMPEAPCVFCVDRPADSKEHLFALTLGGRFWLPISCTTCNNEAGAAVESQLLDCGVVQRSLIDLESVARLAALTRKVRRHVDYEGVTDGGDRLELKYRRGKPTPPRKVDTDGVVHCSPEDGAKEIENSLRREGVDLGVEAAAMLGNLNSLASGLFVPVPGTDYFVRREELSVQARVSDVSVPVGMLAKVVLGATALRFGRGIYHASLNALREAVRGNDAPGLHFGYLGDALDGNETAGEHVVRVELAGSTLIADVLLFRKHRFTVTLAGLPDVAEAAGLVIIEDVGAGQTAVNSDLDDFARTKRARVIRPL